MAPLPSNDPPKQPNKRKGSRSVSALTPIQLARKRANDREAQRNIRARTRAHIERLEQEVAELRNFHHDEAVQELMRQNRALEREIEMLRENLNQARHYQTVAAAAAAAAGRYDDRTPGIGGGGPGHSLSRASSAFGGGGGGGPAGTSDYSSSPSNFGGACLPTLEPCEPWPSVVPASAISAVSSVVSISSPASSAAGGGNPEEFVPGGNGAYIPTSVPSSHGIAPSSISCMDPLKMDCDDDSNIKSEPGCGEQQPQQHHSHLHDLPSSLSGYLQPQPRWPMYPAVYYPQSPSL